jgi:proline iminopeptidase
MRHFFCFLALLFLFSNCAQPLKPHEGYVEVTGGKIWYKVIGDGPGKPLMVMHGGPGGRSCGSIEAYQVLASQRPIIFFDQLESGKSDHPNDTTLWKLPYFVEQVEALRKQLNLKSFHLLGSSWGGSIAVEYMVTQNTDAIASVIFAGPLIGTPQWMADSKVLISRLSQPVQDTINKYETLGDYTAPAYLEATDTFNSNFNSRKKGPRLPVADCEGVPGSNRAIYNYMWGPTEFNATGTLRNFDRVSDLHNIAKPTLFIGGEFDEVLPETLYYFQTLVPESKVAIIPGAGHAKTIDNPDAYMNALREFLEEVEGNSN